MFYQKYRPRRFSDLVAQDIIVKILKNFLRDYSSLPQAYLFAGQRGTGKTSTARIFAKSLNCLRPDNAEPCDDCLTCEAFNKNQFLDLIEIDAASHRGIDGMRNIKEHIGFKPLQGKYKVFVIDEAHMLTNEAWNALLKLIEEPPKHTIFIFATTEPEKIPLTILSRVQRLDFQRIPFKAIVEKLKRIAETEGVKTEERALFSIAEESGGALRDAETLFEKLVLSLNPKTEITEEFVETFLGKMSPVKIIDLLELIANKQVESGIKFVQTVYEQGFDLVIFVKGIIKILREALVLKVNPSWEIQLARDYPKEFVERLKQLVASLSLDEIKKAIKVFTEAEFHLKRDLPIPTLPLEIAVVELS
jgi:DNA polymerase-3 subunit gamma/tau